MLFLQYENEKEISPKVAARLRKAKTFMNTMEKFPEDVTLLREALENYKPAQKKRQLTGTSLKLGVFLTPEYKMLERYTIPFCEKRERLKTKKPLYFNYGRTEEYARDVFFSVTEQEEASAEFYLGNFLGWQSQACPEVFKAGAISKIAKYFYNRPEIYEKIYKLLAQQRKEFCLAAGKPFYEALISLFSVKKQPSLKLFGAFQEQKVEQTFNYREAAEAFSLGLFCYIFPPRPKDTAAASNMVFELFLTPKNKLVIKAILVKTPAARQQEVKTFVGTEIKAWVEQLVAVATFEENIYKKLQTALLLKNI